MSSEHILTDLHACVEFVTSVCTKVQGLIASQSGQEHLQQVLQVFQVGGFVLHDCIMSKGILLT